MARIGLNRIQRILLPPEEPTISLEAQVRGATLACTVERHAMGAPIITGKTSADVHYGLGWAMGRDRFFQMDLSRRIAFGELSEVFGDIPLPPEAQNFGAHRLSDLDLFLRGFRFEEESRRQAHQLSPSVRADLEALVAGINAALDQNPMPPEYLVLGRPRRWTLADTIGLAFSFAFMLDIGSLEHEFLVNQFIRAGKSALGQAIYATTGVKFPDFDPAVDEVVAPRVPTNGGGSNAWAVSGSRTASGKPIMASDPHLPLIPIPSMWYHAILRCDEFELSGQSFAGTPSFPIAHNGHAAWGATSTQRDAFDITRVLVASDSSQWLSPKGWVPTRRHEVVIPRRLARPRVAVFHTCDYGTIFQNWRSFGETSIALRMAGARHQEWMRTIDADAWFRGMAIAFRSRSWEEHREGVRLMSDGGLGIHHIYADSDGTIAHQVYGLFPRRPDNQGVVPRDSWEEDSAWNDYLSFDELPHLVNPEQGFVLSANAEPELECGGQWPYLAAVYEPAWRYRTLRAILEKNDQVDVELCRRMQTDTFCAPGPEFRDAILATLTARTVQERAVFQLLRGWDGAYERRSRSAPVIEHTMRRGALRMWTKLLGKALGERFMMSRLATRRFVECVIDPNDALRAQLDEAGISLREVLGEAFRESIAALERSMGSNPEEWRLSSNQDVNLMHAFGVVPPLGRVFDIGKFPVGGGEFTPLAHAAAVSGDRLVVGIGPASRFVCDLAAPSMGHWAQVTGASGRAKHVFAASTTQAWVEGTLYEVPLKANETP